MKTKLFSAFIAIILTALFSNLIYEHFIRRDFDEYVNGAREDKLYWVMAAVEGAYSGGGWDMQTLHEAVHWAAMLGFSISVRDTEGREVMPYSSVMDSLSESMKKKMAGLADVEPSGAEPEIYPLYSGGNEVGSMRVVKLHDSAAAQARESMFRRRGKNFLAISFLIAGGGALVLAAVFSLFLSRPVNLMKKAVGEMARGDFSIRLPESSRKDELGRLAASFNFMAEALQREDATRKRLTSNIAHELRTPLTIMKANVEAMIDGVVADRDAGLQNIRVEVEKLIGLIEGIEDISKAEAAFFSGRNSAPIDLGDFLSGIAGIMKPMAESKGIKLEVSSTKKWEISTDHETLEKIVRNIVSNAIRNTSEGGVSIGCGKDDRNFYIEIADTGKGISDEELPKIFERFYRGKDSTGSGLGLAIVKELTEAMGGRVEVSSTEGRGTTFRVTLPSQA